MKGEHMAAILRVKDENGNIVSIPAIKGDKGEKGDPGEKGEKGERGAPGTVDGLPSGGYKGQSLVKSGDGNGEVEWGGDGLEYDSVMTVPLLVNDGKTSYINIAVDKNPIYAQYYPLTQINEGAELVPAVDYADGYALGYAVFSAQVAAQTGTFASMLDSAEKLRKNFEFLISEGYITNPIGLRYSSFNAFGGSFSIEDYPILKDCRVYYNKMSNKAVIMLYSEYRYTELDYYYDEADIADFWKTSYYVSGHWVLYTSYSKRGEKYNVQPASYAGYLLGCDSDGIPKYTSPTGLNLLQFTEQTLTTEQQSQARQNIGITGIVTSDDIGNPAHTTDLVDYSGFLAGSQLILDQTVAKNQGTSNSGKFLGIGADGIVVPTEVSGGGEFEDPLTGLELIVEHTVTEDENDATSLVFTQEAYPKINNNKILLIYITRPEAGTSPWLEIRAGTQIATQSSQSGSWEWMMYLADGTNGLWLNNWTYTTASINVYRTISPAYGYNGGQVATRTVQFKPYDKITISSWTAWFKTGMVIKIFGSKTT